MARNTCPQSWAPMTGPRGALTGYCIVKVKTDVTLGSAAISASV